MLAETLESTFSEAPSYLLNVINMEHSHPGIHPIFEGGALSIRRTSNLFSRSAVDLTLEQTVNRDTASRQTGILQHDILNIHQLTILKIIQKSLH